MSALFWASGLQCGATIVVSMLILWLISIRRQDVSIVDLFWGSGFVLIAWQALLVSRNESTRPLLATLLITAWGLRLSLYLAWRNLGHGEDRRYGVMRQYHGNQFWWVSLFTVFLLQAVILWTISWPIQALLGTEAQPEWNWLDISGIALWTVGFVFESLGDWQLASFKSQPKNQGKVMDRGLWRYTRHPNYFGDFCVWWGIFCLSAAAGNWWTIFSPVLMSLLLMHVSGVTLLESTISDRRPDYAEYKQRTSPFFPWYPRQSKR